MHKVLRLLYWLHGNGAKTESLDTNYKLTNVCSFNFLMTFINP